MINYFTFSQTEVSVAVVIFNLLLSIGISFFIAYVHKKTHSGLSYSQSFFSTIVLVGIVSTVVLMIIQNNIFGALGLLGAFALIRFRTILKETRDIAFVFFVLAEGVAIGLNHYATALVSTAAISIVVYVIYKFNIGFTSDAKFVLLVTSKAPINDNALNETLKKVKMSANLLSTKKLEEQLFEYTYSIKGDKIALANEALNEFATSQGVIRYDLLSGRESIEY